MTLRAAPHRVAAHIAARREGVGVALTWSLAALAVAAGARCGLGCGWRAEHVRPTLSPPGVAGDWSDAPPRHIFDGGKD